jgi:hypothetical protein
MQLFSCPSCKQVLFFENVSCMRCGRQLAYLPDRGVVTGIDPVADTPGLFTAPLIGPGAQRYRLCSNYTELGVCNWALPADDPTPYCAACRLNEMIPNLGEPGAREAWHKLEQAKRRLIYSLHDLGLPVERKEDHARGLAFSFLRDWPNDARVSTGHQDGKITLNVAEADDPFRERTRVQLGETYRTLLGHFRHEIGHYYWYRLIEGDQAQLAGFRDVFGDETRNYAAEQERHYQQGPPPDWQDRFVSAYASMHPWEDFAETWAHYLHMVDTLDTARAYGVSLRPAPAVGRIVPLEVKTRRVDLHSFEDLMEGWVPLSLALNSLNRSMGTPDSYPFVLSKAAIRKLSFVHDLIERTAAAGAAPPRPASTSASR